MARVLLAGYPATDGIASALTRLDIETSSVPPDDCTEPPQPEGCSAAFVTGGFAVYSEDTRKFTAALCERCAALSVPVILDPDLRNVPHDRIGAVITALSAGVVLTASGRDSVLLCAESDPEAAAKRFLELGAAKVVIIMPEKRGAYFRSAKESGLVPAFRVDYTVDPRSESTAFDAGLISGICEEIPLSESVIRAVAAGCISTEAEGVLECYPTREELRNYMLSHTFDIREQYYDPDLTEPTSENNAEGSSPKLK